LKAEYDISAMKRKGHPLREKVLRGELELISPLDIPDYETKLASLNPDDREFIIELLETKFATSKKLRR
jgi:hypothetical protein